MSEFRSDSSTDSQSIDENSLREKKMNFGPNSLNDLIRNKSFTGSYRIFHITRRSPEESDEEQTLGSKLSQGSEIKIKPQKKSFKLSNRNGLDGWKRRSTKKKSFRFHDSTPNDWKTSPPSYLITNDLAPSINSRRNLPRQTTDLSDPDILGETIRQNDATLDDLLARANQLENAVIKKEFNRIQPSLPRANTHRRRKRFLIACSILLILVMLIVTIVIFFVIRKLKHEKHPYNRSPSSSIYDV